MPTKKRFANCPEIAFPGSLPAKGEELPDRRGGCRDPLVRQRGPAAAGYLKSHPVGPAFPARGGPTGDGPTRRRLYADEEMYFELPDHQQFPLKVKVA